MASAPFSDLLHDSLSTQRHRQEELPKQQKERKNQPLSQPPLPRRKQMINRRSISCVDCRPSVVPLEKSTDRQIHRHSTSNTNDEWRLVATELSKKLLATARKRDEAVVELSRLKQSITELHRELAARNDCPGLVGSLSTEKFLRSVSAARSAVRLLARTLTNHARQSVSPSVLLPHHMEALLNRVFYTGFELTDEDEMKIADPSARCELNKSEYDSVQVLNWDKVLDKGTRHYSDRLSRFCDKRMSEVVGTLGWAPRVWPEHILRTFFGAAKSAWSVRLLARSVHPPVPILRADRGTGFDSRFMEDFAMDETETVQPVTVKLLVMPGFHVYTSNSCVVKCKVLCSHKVQDKKEQKY